MATPKKSFTSPRATARNWAWTLGMVQINLSLTKLHRDSDRIECNTLCPKHKEPVHHGSMVCEYKGKRHEVTDPIKGYQYEKGSWVTLTEDELSAIPSEHTGAIEIMATVPFTSLDPAMYEGTYLAWPQDEVALKPFAILQQYATEKAVAFVGVGTWWGTTRAIILRYDYLRGVMILSTCAFAALERKEDVELVKAIPLPAITDKEWELAEAVFGSLPTMFDFSTVTDTVADRQREVVAEKVKTGKVTVPVPAVEPDSVPDLMEALRRTLIEREAVKV